MKFADLHIHTNYSDSTLSPEQIVLKAVDQGLSCIAIADHDTVDGVVPVQKVAAFHDLEVIPAIELSSELNNQDIHVLGYFMDCKNEIFKVKLREIQDVRIKRIEEMIEKLKEFGIDNITIEEVCALNKSDSVGRPHLAMILEEKGWVSSLQQAFNKYLAEGAPAYVKKYKQTPYEAIELIQKAGGVAVLAHPMVTKRDELIPSLVKAGLKGLEVYYPNCPKSVEKYYEGLVKKHDLIATGGSDAHGEGKPNTFIGKAKAPYSAVEQLRQASHG
ncbi:MAG: PHP domain-containing protein [Candidatus Aceula meridiana]|nr:PHP domain-containing protein [Candidatus Aceula meridiana]